MAIVTAAPEAQPLETVSSPLGSTHHRPASAEGLIEVSVCIVNWNCRELLSSCLKSLTEAAQGVALEVIVIDNASADGAADMVEREFPDVVLQRNATNVGFARGNNQAAELSRGRYLFFLNNDTIVPPTTLRRLLDYCLAHPHVGMVGPRLRDGQGRAQVSYRLRPTLSTLLHRTNVLRWTGLLKSAYHRYRREDFDPETTRPVEVLMGAAMFLPREVFFTCGAWDEEFTFGGEDIELSVRIGRDYQVIYLPEVEITHYGRVSTRQHIGFASTNMAIGFARYLRKSGCSEWGLALYKLAVTLDVPLQMLDKGMQYLWRRFRGHREKAEKSRLVVQGLLHFLREGIGPLWRV
jgi:N-acetylglucosaminyl-diphospho-decaprenol L-rhamnosyltransferase